MSSILDMEIHMHICANAQQDFHERIKNEFVYAGFECNVWL